MIQKHFLFPQYYIHKVAICDNCKCELYFTGTELLTDPPIKVMKCPKCGKEYNIHPKELQGEWKWRAI